MTQRFPATALEAFEKFVKQLAADVQRMKTVTAVLEPGCYVISYIGTIPGSYTSGDPTVTLPAGNTIGPCRHVASYTPHAGDTVLLVPAGQSYIVVGALA